MILLLLFKYHLRLCYLCFLVARLILLLLLDFQLLCSELKKGSKGCRYVIFVVLNSITGQFPFPFRELSSLGIPILFLLTLRRLQNKKFW